MFLDVEGAVEALLEDFILKSSESSCDMFENIFCTNEGGSTSKKNKNMLRCNKKSY